MFAAKEHAIQIDGQAMTPGFQCHFLQIAAGSADAGAVKQNVEMAKTVQNFGANRLPAGLAGGVLGAEQTSCAGRRDVSGDFFALDLLNIGENDGGAFCRHQFAGGFAQTRSAAGQQRNFPFQSITHDLPSRFFLRAGSLGDPSAGRKVSGF